MSYPNIDRKGLGREQVTAMLKPLAQVEALYRGFDAAEKVVTNFLGRGICMEHCGKCCEVTSPDIWEVEARFAISAILGSGGARIEEIASAC